MGDAVSAPRGADHFIITAGGSPGDEGRGESPARPPPGGACARHVERRPVLRAVLRGVPQVP